VQEVNRLIDQHKAMQKLMKQMKGMGMMGMMKGGMRGSLPRN
jgi:signal recognition particle GTPase